MADGQVIGTRIDRGVKRGARKTPHNSRLARGLTAKPRPEDLGTWQIPSDLNPHEVLQRYLTEATTSQIASQYGLSRRALVKWLRQTVPTEWKEIQLIRAHSMLEKGEDGIEDAEAAQSAISLACTRERIKAAQWRLQALDNDYHPKQELTITDKTDLGDRLRRSRERVIDSVATPVAEPRQVALQQQPIIDVVPEQQIVSEE